ncbi:Uncharacterized protein TCAP_06250 [Tolypocladium capitatum]|uniref:Uncharacterized protein n=1 Tax=Tolypocladium capitatum TaxID=45235 RepID=A0A2K3Q8B3_9HYPO|nr:Uncharacterized protein TCAP_06250 [Tolypocladium capitatum]
MSSADPERATVGFLGLGAIGCDLARRLLQSSRYRAKGCSGHDGDAPSAQRFVALGGQLTEVPRDAAAGCDFIICTAPGGQQIDDMLFAEKTGALEALPRNATLLIGGTATPAYFDMLLRRITQAGREDLRLVDSPVARGIKGSTEEAVAIFASGAPDAVGRADRLLRTASEKLHIIPGGLGAATKVHMVNSLLTGSHTAAAAEAIGLMARAGLNTQQVYNIIASAAGSSSAFGSRVLQMLRGDWTPRSSLGSCIRDMDAVAAAARAINFPLHLGGAAERLFIYGASQGYGSEDDAGLIRLYLPSTPDLVRDGAKPVNIKEALAPGSSPLEISKIGIVGLGAMGQGMAASLIRAGFTVQGFDVLPAAIDKFVSGGPKAIAVSSPAEAASADVVVLMVQNASQVDDVLFGSGKGADALPDGAIIILSSMVPPSFVRDLDTRLRTLGRGLSLVDAPVSGGVVRAANGTLTMIFSAEQSILPRVNSVLLAMTGVSSNLCHVEGGVGTASSVKLVNQLLEGVHIAAAAEAMAFAARLNLDTKLMFDILKSTGAWSWMLENRVPQMLEADWTPHSALAMFKDLGIVLDEARRLRYHVPMASAAHSLYLAGASRGWSKESDAGVVRLWELPGSSVAERAGPRDSEGGGDTHADYDGAGSQPEPLPANATLDSLPPEYGTDVSGSVRDVVENGGMPTLVVLDDDPTGTQTCHDIDVLTVWDAETLGQEFSLDPRGFFILTNSRALPSAEARRLIAGICKNVAVAAEKAQKTFDIVLRGDSTLRGHLPEEPEAVEETLGLFDGWVMTPFFSQGGRFTINDVHYVKEDDVLVPASQTPFAQDATFGYKNSNLRHYMMEKCGTRFRESSFLSVTLDDIRRGGPSAVAQRLLSVLPDPNRVIIVNAVADSDMHVFVAGLLEAAKGGRRYLYRTGAAFVSSRLGITGIPPRTLEDVDVDAAAGSPHNGGLIVAGSYVPKTTAQLKVLRERRGDKLAVIELDVAELLASPEEAKSMVGAAAAEASRLMAAGRDVLVMTSRTLIRGHDGASSLRIGSKVAHALVQFVQGINVRPRYLIAKGGITSSDAATKGLAMRRARVLGQAAPGVPLWRCDEETSRHRGVPYVVFPGNVGSESALAEVVEAWATAGYTGSTRR